jgi:hypothetical protein
VGQQGLLRRGKKKWRAHVHATIEMLRAALEPEYIVLGGGNSKLLVPKLPDGSDALPEGVRIGSNANAYLGGLRLWNPAAKAKPASEKAR